MERTCGIFRKSILKTHLLSQILSSLLVSRSNLWIFSEYSIFRHKRMKGRKEEASTSHLACAWIANAQGSLAGSLGTCLHYVETMLRRAIYSLLHKILDYLNRQGRGGAKDQGQLWPVLYQLCCQATIKGGGCTIHSNRLVSLKMFGKY